VGCIDFMPGEAPLLRLEGDNETRDWHGLMLLRYTLAIEQRDALAAQTEPNRV
jgi:hypothetical protein